MELTSMFKRMDVDQNNDTRTLKLLYYICINDQDQDLEITDLSMSPLQGSVRGNSTTESSTDLGCKGPLLPTPPLFLMNQRPTLIAGDSLPTNGGFRESKYQHLLRLDVLIFIGKEVYSWLYRAVAGFL